MVPCGKLSRMDHSSFSNNENDALADSVNPMSDTTFSRDAKEVQSINYKITIIIFRLTTNTKHLSKSVQSIFHNLQGCSNHDGHGCSKSDRVRQSGMGHLVNSDRRPSTV